MVKVGSLKEKVGTPNIDRLLVRDKEVAYSLGGNDQLNAATDSLLGTRAGFFLVGGFGDDSYQAAKRGVTVVMDLGNSGDDDFVSATGIGINKSSSFVMDIDRRHLLAGDVNTGQVIVIIDWKQQQNRIEKVRLSNGVYAYDDVVSSYKGFGNYLGNVSWGRLVNEGFLDLDRVGLKPRGINRAIRKITRRAKDLQKESFRSNLAAVGSRTAISQSNPLSSSLLEPEAIVAAHPLQMNHR